MVSLEEIPLGFPFVEPSSLNVQKEIKQFSHIRCLMICPAELCSSGFIPADFRIPYPFESLMKLDEPQ